MTTRTLPTPDDPRHGEVRGYRAGCRDQCCRAAMKRYNQARRLRKLRGQPTTTQVPVTGTRRRLQALAWMGWSSPMIATRLGLRDGSYISRLTNAREGGPTDRVQARVANAVAELYDDLADQQPDGTPAARQGVTVTRRHARRKGWVPPWGWDDIDTDTDPIPYRDRKRPATGRRSRPVDPIIVERVLGGDTSIAADATPAERRAVVARCADPATAPFSLTRLAEITGWNVQRYVRELRASTVHDNDQETAA